MECWAEGWEKGVLWGIGFEGIAMSTAAQDLIQNSGRVKAEGLSEHEEYM